ncbi:hypothetical protein PG985_000302 [Apiospora marii]|uniref:Gfd2/YDR514C-like C-terminal domain-containing protein n=1 Tax=Apiospora marii TaxID=335849 RepID=A0ABR1R1N5_9PEZI
MAPKWKYATKDRLKTLVGLRPYDEGSNDFEPVFVGFDIEAVRDERLRAANSPEYEPRVAEVGLAILDSRDFAAPTSSIPRGELIQRYRVGGTASSGSPSTGAGGEPPIAAQVGGKIRIPDGMSCDGGRWRNIVIVGHSPQSDLTMLKNLGLDLDECGMGYEILDTHKLANDILSSGGSKAEGRKSWTLEGVMEQLGCTYNRKRLHRAIHDARYHLQTMAMLACQAFDRDQTTPLPISDNPNCFAPPQQTGEQARRDLLQEWCRVEFGDDGQNSEVQPSPGPSRRRRRIVPSMSGKHGRQRSKSGEPAK